MADVIVQPCIGVEDASCVEVCPVDEVVVQWRDFIKINADYFKNRQ